MAKSSYIIRNTGVTLTHKGKTHQAPLPKDKARFITLLTEGRYDKALAMIDTKAKIEQASGKAVTCNQVGDVILAKDRAIIPEKLLHLIEDLIAQQKPVDCFVNFWKRLKQNPVEASKKELFDFLQHQDLKLTDDGYIVAYKGVTQNYRDCHSQTFDNTPGRVLSMPPEKVDPNRRNHCSYGFHVGSWEYASHFGPVTLEVLVDPKDAIAVPEDHSCQKMRVCKYRVLREVTGRTHEEVLATGKLHSEKPATSREKASVTLEKSSWKLRRVSEGRVWIPKEPLEQVGFKANQEILVYVLKDCIELRPVALAKKQPDFILATNADTNVRLAKSILNAITKGKVLILSPHNNAFLRLKKE